MRVKAMGVMLAFVLVSGAFGSPRILTYQGSLLRSGGGVVNDGTYDMRFSIYDVASGGSALWTETDTGVQVTGGLFSTVLGDGIAFWSTFFPWHYDLWLEVEIDVDGSAAFEADEVFSPRQRLTAAPWAMDSDRLNGRDASAFAEASHHHDGRYYTEAELNTSGGGGAVHWNNLTGVPGGFADGIDHTDDTVSWAEVSGIVGTGSNHVAAGNHNHGDIYWELDGNTIAPGQFLGTTNDMTLDFRVNGTHAFRIDTADPPNIIGGQVNQVTAGVGGAAIGGGGLPGGGPIQPQRNRVTDHFGTVGGGANNRAGDNDADVTDAQYATVGGGDSNFATGPDSVVAGGDSNQATSQSATVGGGEGNMASGREATVGGGYHNTASGREATVGGGYYNTASAQDATVGGGGSNNATSECATVAGGNSNEASGYFATVGGGISNSAISHSATVAGGYSNDATGQTATVGGGEINTASGECSTIAGGYINTASGVCSTVGGGGGPWGGNGNTASGDYATVPGGYDNVAAGEYSFAAGRSARASHPGAFVWADSTPAAFTSGGNNQFAVRANGGVRFVVKNGEWVKIQDDGTNLINTTAGSPGARLTIGGTWTNASDRNHKENIVPVDGRSVLENLNRIPISTWNYEAEDPSIRHMGPMAQDLYGAFGLGDSDGSITTIDADGISMAAIQGLYQLVQDKQAQIADLAAAKAAQHQRIADLESRLAALETLVATLAER